MIKLRSMEQAQALSIVLDTEAGADALHIGQAADGVVGVSRIDEDGRMEKHTYVMIDGDTREIDYATR